MWLICIQYESSFIKIREIDYSKEMVLKWEKNELSRKENKTHTSHTSRTHTDTEWERETKRDTHTRRRRRRRRRRMKDFSGGF